MSCEVVLAEVFIGMRYEVVAIRWRIFGWGLGLRESALILFGCVSGVLRG